MVCAEPPTNMDTMDRQDVHTEKAVTPLLPRYIMTMPLIHVSRKKFKTVLMVLGRPVETVSFSSPTASPAGTASGFSVSQ